MDNLKKWDDIKDQYKDGSLIIGNGASIAVDLSSGDSNFDYKSLYKKACDYKLIDQALKNIFVSLKTEDFENILSKLLQAKIVNEALLSDSEPINNSIEAAYKKCQESLIKVVQKIHPQYEKIFDCTQFDKIATFLKNFKMVISLNYDLLLYWSIIQGNKKSGLCDHKFKDCFSEKTNDGNQRFNLNWELLKEPYGLTKSVTLVFYLHGNLSLVDKEGGTKITVSPSSENLLKTICDKWAKENLVPLFICEGEKEKKLESIRKNVYLSTIYNKVLYELGETIVVYGWSMKDQDNHVLEQLSNAHKKTAFKKIAISLYEKPSAEEKKRITEKMQKIIKNLPTIDFYDAESPNCWNH